MTTITMRELEIALVARRGMSIEELEPRRYESSKLGGHPRCLLGNAVRKQMHLRRMRKTCKEDDEVLPTACAANTNLTR